MTEQEIVRALRDMATYDCGFEEQSDTAIQAASLIENLQAENERLAVQGGKYIAIADERYKMYEKAVKRAEEAEIKLSASQRRAQDARNELCQRCGRYLTAHNGSCDGCRWREEV